ncbi:hypothetical protein [Pelagibius sp. Alg239-R121]|uniref:hypothetical protein n=1 Tax=Pelagibius sp. Alg239-R121 TaxID=2993448 RepID=UPI0024A62E3B|nr:hypothetical protein [Pelagibius sp. Alg239-R121]
MSRLKSARTLMDAKVKGVAPTVSTLAGGQTTKDDSERNSPAGEATGKKPSRKKRALPAAKNEAPTRKTLRCTLSVPPGSETEQVILDLIARLPAKSQSRINVGGMFRDLIEENDAAVARMLRAVIE